MPTTNDPLDACDDDRIDPFLTQKTAADPDTLYRHEALRQPDTAKFLSAMVEEIEGQSKNGNWEIIPRCKLPQGILYFPQCGH